MLRNLLLSFTVVAVMLGGSELVCRLVEAPPRPLEASDRAADWEQDWGTDFYVMRSESSGWPPRDEFNREGVRDRARAQEKPAGTRRVVCLGDSVTLGYGIRREESYPSRLQALLDERGPGVEVMTVALMGWATRQERIAYERIVRRYSPDLVLLGVCLNDLLDMQNNLAQPPAWLTRLHDRSALVRRVVDAEGRQIRSVRDLVTDPETGRVRQGYQRLFQEVRRLRKEVEKDGARLAVVVFPFADQVGDAPMAATPQRTIEAFCAAEKIPFIDPLPQVSPLGGVAFRPDDHLHLSAQGSLQVARAIQSSGVIPPEWASSSSLPPALGRPSPLVLGQEDVPRLAGLLTAKDVEVRRQAAWALGRLGGEARGTWRPLVARLEDPDEGVRIQAARSLGQLRVTEARPALLEVLADPRQGVRWAAAEVLAAIGMEPTEATGLVQALPSSDPYVRAFASWALGAMGKPAGWTAPEVARQLADDDLSVRSTAATSIGQLGDARPAVVTALDRALADQAWAGRWRAVRALGLLGESSASAITSLAAALKDGDERVRREAARALGRIGPAAESALPALVAARGDPSESVRQAAEAAVVQLTTSAK